ncbi:motility accessory factor [Campylobacter insulaenigrae]|uniref:motility associated factor glycosyltransferase family protein n=3 Tax=Campylobacter insulaenigrae TaxID=260714 RepID=UPI000F6B40CF|nr:motility associated factor glycosyltransferase family protein [Campylobacter insulaenigrae]VEJ54919.1 motility accessory factor [Campylobacter insulaenigrae]
MLKNNLDSINFPDLKASLSAINSSKFQIIQGKDNLDINLLNTQDNTLMYENTLEELNAMLNAYHEKYFLYPVLYFYGFGNGILYKALLQNQNHKHIIVFENDLELIYAMFQILDFSKELKDNKLIILDTKKVNILNMQALCSHPDIFTFLRTYFLELHSNYYEKYQDDILDINKKMSESIKNTTLINGNSPIDALQGIEQFVYNIPSMVSNPSYKELLNKRKNLSDTAIIVSTGPSLIKQLPLLKQYSNKATIFCADSAYPILAKYNIKPDYVCMLERIDITAEFFNNDFGEFDKDIVFICACLIHPKAIEYLEKSKRKYILFQRYLSFQLNLNLKQFDYLVFIPSVAHVAYTLATNLNHKNIILIGQDLAYADNGDSHPKEYQNSATFESDIYDHVDTLAYGGGYMVKTHFIWLLFKNDLEKLILMNKTHTTYNCTEGGARIEGAIEKPFKEICETLLNKNLHKPFAKLDTLNINKQNELLLKAYYKINQSIKKCVDLKKDFQKELNFLNKMMNDFLLSANERLLNDMILHIDKIKMIIEDIKVIGSIHEILSPTIVQFELNLARIYVLNPKTKEDSFNKSVLWIKEHLEWIQLIIAHINAQKLGLIKNIKQLEYVLINRGFEKLVEKIRK